MNFRVNTRTEAGTLVVAFFGEFDLAAAESIQEPWELGGAGGVEADVCGVEFMDSSGLRVILRLKAQVEDEGLSFWLRCPSLGPVDRVLEITGMKQKLTILEPDVAAEEAAI